MEEKDELVLAFSFAASEFLDEELWYIEDEFGKIDFITKGKYINSDTNSSHPAGYYAPQSAVDELNLLYKNKKQIKLS